MLLRVIHDQALPPALNMGVDEALLQLAELPTLRLYGWQPHAVSLGYFQRIADFDDVAATTPIVRRLTGGGAIYHGDELTFALALDAALLPRDVAASYRLLHEAAIAALADAGVASHLVTDGEAPSARPADRWCFRSATRDDVATAKGKLLGSAQRRIRTPHPRVLHHGSLVLERPPATPFVAAVADATPTDAALRARLGRRLAAHLATSLQLTPVPGELSAAERELAERLARERYTDPAFVRAR